MAPLLDTGFNVPILSKPTECIIELMHSDGFWQTYDRLYKKLWNYLVLWMAKVDDMVFR